MRKHSKKRSHKAGMAPGSLVYIGDREKTASAIELIDYDTEQFRRGYIPVEECAAYRDTPTVSWINVEGVQDVAVLEQLGEDFHLHPLTLEDILNTDQRPKMEEYDEYLFIVIKMLRLSENRVDLVTEQVSIILGEHFVISFQDDISGDVFESLRERLKAAKGRIRNVRTDYLCYSLIDAVVDNYFLILETIGERIETLEAELIADPEPATLESIHHVKRELIYLRRSVWPLREVISALQREDTPLISAATGVFLRDVYDHTIQIIDTVETHRDILSGMIDMYMSSISNRMNEVMKVLTIIATVFIPLTFIAGVYGMNFDYMPELRMPWAYPVLWILMIAVAGGMFLYFRRKKWI